MSNISAVLGCFLSWFLIWPIMIWAPRLYLLDYINAFGLAFGLTVIWRYGPGAIVTIGRALRASPPITRGDMLTLGIALTWIAMVARTVVLWRWRWLDEPDGGLDGADVAFVAWIIISGGVCHLIASTMKDQYTEAPALSERLVIGVTAVGLVLGTLIATGRYVVQS
jgi:hypothetical protein